MQGNGLKGYGQTHSTNTFEFQAEIFCNILKTKDRSIQRIGSKINMGKKTQIIHLEAGFKIKNYFLEMMLQKTFFWKIRSIFGNAAQDVLVKRNRQDDYAEIQAAFQNLLFWSENVMFYYRLHLKAIISHAQQNLEPNVGDVESNPYWLWEACSTTIPSTVTS